MREVVNKIFTVLTHSDDDEFMSAPLQWGASQSVQWDEPELLTRFIFSE